MWLKPSKPNVSSLRGLVLLEIDDLMTDMVAGITETTVTAIETTETIEITGTTEIEEAATGLEEVLEVTGTGVAGSLEVDKVVDGEIGMTVIVVVVLTTEGHGGAEVVEVVWVEAMIVAVVATIRTEVVMVVEEETQRAGATTRGLVVLRGEAGISNHSKTTLSGKARAKVKVRLQDTALAGKAMDNNSKVSNIRAMAKVQLGTPLRDTLAMAMVVILTIGTNSIIRVTEGGASSKREQLQLVL